MNGDVLCFLICRETAESGGERQKGKLSRAFRQQRWFPERLPDVPEIINPGHGLPSSLTGHHVRQNSQLPSRISTSCPAPVFPMSVPLLSDIPAGV